MTKRIAIMLLAVLLSTFAFAQEEKSSEEKNDGEQTGGFKVEHLFTGGTINLNFFNGITQIGAAPQLGYSVTGWLDAGVVLSYNYISQSFNVGTKARQRLIGPGVFARVFPVDFLFATIQFEHNFINYKEIYPGFSNTYKYDVSSLLAGIGYTSGREGRNSPYYYFSVSFDVLNNPLSPYRTIANEVYPVFNAGFNIPLFQGRGRSR